MKTKICRVKDCTTPLSLELSGILGICRWCRAQFHADWTEDDWLHDWVEMMEDDEDPCICIPDEPNPMCESCF